MSYLTIAESADRLDITRQAVLKLVKNGSMPSVPEMRGGSVHRYLIPESAVSDRLDSIEAPSGYYSVPRVAHVLGVDSTTVRRWVSAGKLKAFVTPSGRRFVNLEAAASFKSGGLS